MVRGILMLQLGMGQNQARLISGDSYLYSYCTGVVPSKSTDKIKELLSGLQ